MTFDKKNLAQSDKRSGKDRRFRPTPSIGKYWLHGLRRAPRRKVDRQTNYYVDRYSFRTLGAILLIIAMSIVDASLTLHLIRKGAAELNPVMAYFLDHGPRVFMGVKYLLTCASVLLLLINNNVYLFRTKLRARYLFLVFLLIFTLVILWEFYLILFVVA